MTKGEKRMVRKPATKSANLRKKMDQRKARAKPVKKTSAKPVKDTRK